MEVDIENCEVLRQYLTRHGYIGSDDHVVFEKLAGGISNRTVKVVWCNGRGWVVKQALAKLRVCVDWFSDPERILVEAKALQWLNHIIPEATPAFIFEDSANHMLAMQAISDPHENWKSVLLSGQIVPDQFQQFGRLLGTIHYCSSGNEIVEERRRFVDTRYFENLRLEPYYLYTAEKVPAASNFLHSLVCETRSHKHCLVHGDFSPKNALLYHGKLILLDYEVFHFGEPAFDIGFALGHFLSKAHHLPENRKSLLEATRLFVKAYRQEIQSLDWATSLEPRLVRHALGCTLARVAGKSQLEYLTQEEKTRQQNIVLQLIANPPASVEDLILQFIPMIETYAKN